MNYRHAFHAGNFADVLKHMVLTDALTRLMAKDKGLRLIDLFAGIGWYDLASDEASRSPEWREGIARIRAHPGPLPEMVESWLACTDAAVRRFCEPSVQSYPGSPALMAAQLRPQDELMVCELHPKDVLTLEDRLGDVRRVSVVARNGWQAGRAYLPPPTRRGLVLIDPPFEQPGEFDRMLSALEDGLARFETGTFILWYADKDEAVTASWLREIAKLQARALTGWLSVAAAGSMPGLLACGVVVVNPPFGHEEALAKALPWLCKVLARGEGAGFELRRLSGNW